MWSGTGSSSNTTQVVAVAVVAAIATPMLFLYHHHRYVRRAYYTLKAIKERHKPFDDNVWQETDVEVLLMKVISKTSRSMGVTFMMWPERQFKATLFAYLYFRVVDTLADDVLGGDDQKLSGLNKLKDRLLSLSKDINPGPFPADDYKFLELTARQRSYKLIVQNLHRFDDLWFLLSAKDKKIVYDYCIQLVDGNIRLVQIGSGTKRLEEECTTAIEIGLTYGFMPIFDMPEVAEHIKDGKSTREGQAWKAWARAICVGQLVSTIEEDLKENICFDDELVGMLGDGVDGSDGNKKTEEEIEANKQIVAKVRSKYVRTGLENYTKTLPFFLYEPVMKPIGLRLMFLQFTVVALNVYERELAKVGILPKRKVNVWWVMIKSALQSIVSLNSYQQAITYQIEERAKPMLALYNKNNNDDGDTI